MDTRDYFNRKTLIELNTKHQIDILDKTYDKTQYPDVSIVDQLASMFELTTDKISIWFQNRRAKFRRSETSNQSSSFNELNYNSNKSFFKTNNNCTTDSNKKYKYESKESSFCFISYRFWS